MTIKRVAITGLLAFVGMFSGCLIAPNVMGPPEPVVPEGVAVGNCGLQAISQMFIGSVIGLTAGAGIGALVAYLLPPPPTNT